MRGAKETRPCAACGKLLVRLISQAKGNLWFCNHVCQASFMPPPGSVAEETNPYRGQKAVKPCDECGKPVERYLTPARKDKPWYCSYACRGRWSQRLREENGTFVRGVKPRTGDTVNCLVCGKAFYRQPAYIKQNRKLCSRECNAAWQTKTPVVKQCLHCGKEIRIKPSQVARLYCNTACWMAGKTKSATGDMHNGRPVLKNTAGYLTVYEPTHLAANKQGRVLQHRLIVEKIIGRYLTREEHVDHINAVKDDNRPENLQVLTPSDHSKKTNADNLGALPILRKKLTDQELALLELEAYRQRFGPLPSD